MFQPQLMTGQRILATGDNIHLRRDRSVSAGQATRDGMEPQNQMDRAQR